MTQETKDLWLKNICLYTLTLYTILTLVSFTLLNKNYENVFMIILTTFFALETVKSFLTAILSIKNRWIPYYKKFPLFKLVRWIFVTIGLVSIMHYQDQLNEFFKWVSILITVIIGLFTLDTFREIIEKSKEFKYCFNVKEIQDEFKDFLTSNTLRVGDKFDNINGYIDQEIHMYSVDKEDYYDDVYTGSTFGSKNSLNIISYQEKLYKLDDIKAYIQEQDITFKNMKKEDWDVIEMMNIH